MQNHPVLLPAPHNLEFNDGFCSLDDKRCLLLSVDQPLSQIFPAHRVQAALESNFQIKLEISAAATIPSKLVGISFHLDLQATEKPQGYHLKIAPAGISIIAHDNCGLFYGCCTLIQLIQYYGAASGIIHDIPFASLPCLEIHDWPDFPHRGVMLDISRDRVPTMNTIFELVDLLASWKVNQLQLYTEHTFAYRHHPDVWAASSPFTGEEILELDAFCRLRFIELVPNQNSFGHLESWLKLPRFQPLAESPGGYDLPSGEHLPPFSLCPLDPGSLILLQGLYAELLPHFSSRQFNIGCDETFDLGQGRSKSESERLGVGRVYLDFLLKIYHEVTRHGFTVQFWGDIVMAHPELVKELPEDITALDWGYEANYPFDEHAELLAEAGLSFYVCPGTSSWNSISGRTDNCIENLNNAAETGLKYGAVGYLNTDWGDNGHWQCLPVSYLGFAVGAACSWAYQANCNLDIRPALDLYAFRDPDASMGRMAFDLGNVYHEVGIEPDNASLLFEVLQNPIHTWVNSFVPEKGIQVMRHTLDTIDHITSNCYPKSSTRTGRDILEAEFALTIDLLRHACMRGCYAFGSPEFNQHFLSTDLERIIASYQRVWLTRSRPGGLTDSLSYFQNARKDYSPD